jgi:hypothetical protein
MTYAMAKTTAKVKLITRYVNVLFMTLQVRPTAGLSGAGPKMPECKQDAPSRVRSRSLVRLRRPFSPAAASV